MNRIKKGSYLKRHKPFLFNSKGELQLIFIKLRHHLLILVLQLHIILHALIESRYINEIFNHTDLAGLDSLIQQCQAILAFQNRIVFVHRSLQSDRLVIQLVQFTFHGRCRTFQLKVGIKSLRFSLLYIIPV